MVTSELISYIKKQIESNIPRSVIIAKLLEAGWYKDDIDEGFSEIELESKPKVEIAKVELPKVEPIKIEPAIIEPIKTELSKIENIKAVIEEKETEIVVQSEELPQGKEEFMPTLMPKVAKIEPSIEIAKTEPVIEIAKVEEIKVEPKVEIKPEPVVNTKVDTEPRIQPVFVRPSGGNVMSEVRPANKPVFIPKVNIETPKSNTPRMTVDSFGSVNKENKVDLSTKDNKVSTPQETPKDFQIKNLPKIAQAPTGPMIDASEEVDSLRKHKNKKWIIIIVAIIAVALATLIFAGDLMKISLIKKDPKMLLLDNSKILSSLKAYKTESDIKISSPSFVSIASGIASGEPINSPDQDYISVNNMGVMDNNNTATFSDNFITIKSSLLDNYIVSDVKNNGQILFVTVPDLKELLKDNTPESSIVRIKKDEFNMVPALFFGQVRSVLEKVDLYKILSNGIFSGIDNNTLSSYNEFISSTDITDKGEESIKGVNTYHYLINTNRQSARNLLSQIVNSFSSNLSADDKSTLDGIVGSVAIQSLDIWIGKSDSNIYQFNVVVDVPLSKILGFDDKSVGNNFVSISWKTTYYDFNTPNNVTMPNMSIPMSDFARVINEAKAKNDISAFSGLAKNLSNIENSFGNKSNQKGSCMEPVSGSLFSPLGHEKNTTLVVSSISELMNKILKTTSNVGYCYSTTKEWSFTAPILTKYTDVPLPNPEYKSYYCVDSTGAKKELTAPPSGVTCISTQTQVPTDTQTKTVTTTKKP